MHAGRKWLRYVPEGTTRGCSGTVGSLDHGKGLSRVHGTVRAVILGTTAATVRLGLTAIAGALLAAFLISGRADGAGHSWRLLLAPGGVCERASDPSAAASVQVHAVYCLINWARTHDRRARLLARPALQRAAALKGKHITLCRQFSHTPCGTEVTEAVYAAGYRYSSFGENLFAGTWGSVSPRAVVSAWLQSPPHRANILDANFRDFGAAPVRATGLLGDGDAVVWTATFASPG